MCGPVVFDAFHITSEYIRVRLVKNSLVEFETYFDQACSKDILQIESDSVMESQQNIYLSHDHYTLSRRKSA